MSRNTATLRAARDAFVSKNKPAGNFHKSINISARAIGANTGRYAYIYFPVKIPKNATIIKATLKLVRRHATTGSRTVSVRRLSQNWNQSRVTWNRQPDVVGNAVSVTKAGRPANDVWEFNVTSHMQLVANGAQFYGWRIETNSSAIEYFRSSDAQVGKPILEIEWEEAPYPPNDLHPSSNGVVSTPSPTLAWDFRDNRGTTSMGGYRLQIASDNTFNNILYDSGNVNASVPILDLATASGWTPLEEDTNVFWRVRVRDSANNWSNWSDVARFRYLAKGSLTLVSPTANTVSDASPTITWNLAGRTQSQWQIIVRGPIGGERYDSGKRTSMDQSFEVPAKFNGKHVFPRRDWDYTITLRVWDDVDRSGTVANDVMYEIVRQVSYNPSASGSNITNLTVTDLSVLGEPGLALTWSRSEAPDRYDIWRAAVINGVQQPFIRLDALDPGDVGVGVGEYRYVDYTARHNTLYRYRVGASYSGGTSEATPVTGMRTKKSTGIWLIDPATDTRVRLLGDDAGTWEMGEDSTTYTPVGASSTRLVTQALRGYEGSISGVLMDNDNETVYEQEQKMFDLKATPGATYMLVLPDMAFPVVISNVNVEPTPHKETVRNVSFNFYQQGDLPFRDTL